MVFQHGGGVWWGGGVFFQGEDGIRDLVRARWLGDVYKRQLLKRGLIEELGHDEESTAILYGTTSYFLERLGLSDLDDLPALAPYLPEVDLLDEIAEGGRS